jgi:hypothetical protein
MKRQVRDTSEIGEGVGMRGRALLNEFAKSFLPRSAAVVIVALLLPSSGGCSRGASEPGKGTDGQASPHLSQPNRDQRQGVLKNLVGGGRKDAPWTIAEALDESKRELIDRCDAMREELLNHSDRTCRTSTDCMTTSGCIPVSIGAREEARVFEKRWLSAGCPAKPSCLQESVVCERGKCAF